MAEPLVIIGVGGFGRETIDVVRAINAETTQPWDLLGLIDDSPSELNLQRLRALEVPWLGTVDALAGMSRRTSVALAVGSPSARARIATRLDDWGFGSPDLCHPATVLGGAFRCSGGLIACAHVSIGTNVELGRHVHLNPHAVVGHDTKFSDFVSVNPNATVSGDCEIGPEVLIGAGAVVLQDLSIGGDATIGAAACVTREVIRGQTVSGVPARSAESGASSCR